MGLSESPIIGKRSEKRIRAAEVSRTGKTACGVAAQVVATGIGKCVIAVGRSVVRNNDVSEGEIGRTGAVKNSAAVPRIGIVGDGNIGEA
jgi:hypothetical protein